MKKISILLSAAILFCFFGLNLGSVVSAQENVPQISYISSDYFSDTAGSPNVITGENLTSDTTIYSETENQPVVVNSDVVKTLGTPDMDKPDGDLTSNGDLVPIIDNSNNTITSQLNGNLIWLVNANGTSKPYRINKNEVFWISDSTVERGGALKIFGMGLTTHPFIVLKKGNKYIDVTNRIFTDAVQDRNDDSYLVPFDLPNDIDLGSWTIYLNNGKSIYNWVDAGNVNVVQNTNRDYKSFLTNTTGSKNDLKVLYAKSYGAKGDGKTNDSQAIENAMAKAQKINGAVFFEPGTYMVDETVNVPQGVTLLGSGSGNTNIEGYGYNPASNIDNKAWYSYNDNNNNVPYSVIMLNSGAGLNSLTIKGEVNKGSGGFGLVQLAMNKFNLSQDGLNENVTIDSCNISCEDQSNETSDLLYRMAIYSPCTTNYFKLLNSTVNNSVILGGYGCFINHCDFTGNTFSGGTDYDNLSFQVYAIDSLFDNNQWDNSPGRININPIRNNYIRYNEIHDFAKNTWNNDEEVFLAHGSASNARKSIGLVKSAASSSITDTKQNWAKDFYKDAIVLISNGRGKGQFRYVTGNNGNTLYLDQPFNVIPDSTSEYLVGFLYSENVYYGDINDSVGRFSFNHDCIDNIVENYRDDRGGLEVTGVDSSSINSQSNTTAGEDYAPSWYNVVNNCWFDGSSVNFDSASSPIAATNSLPMFANTFSNNYINYSSLDRSGFSQMGTEPYSLQVGNEYASDTSPYDQSNMIIFNNKIENADLGIMIQKSSYKTIVIGNEFDNVKQPMSDLGAYTIFTGNVNSVYDSTKGSYQKNAIPDKISQTGTLSFSSKDLSNLDIVTPEYQYELYNLMTLTSSLTHQRVDDPKATAEDTNNLKNLWSLITQFNDKNKCLPPAAFYPENENSTNNLIRMLGTDAFKYGMDPSYAKDMIGLVNIEYVYNSNLGGQPLSNISDPSKTWVLMDMSGTHTWMVQNGFAGHQGGINVLYADGTVHLIKGTDVDLSKIMLPTTFKDPSKRINSIKLTLYNDITNNGGMNIPLTTGLAFIIFLVIAMFSFIIVKKSKKKTELKKIDSE